MLAGKSISPVAPLLCLLCFFAITAVRGADKCVDPSTCGGPSGPTTVSAWRCEDGRCTCPAGAHLGPPGEPEEMGKNRCYNCPSYENIPESKPNQYSCPCPPNKEWNGEFGTCDDCPDHSSGGPGGYKPCRCDSGYTHCGNSCLDVSNNDNACGGCFTWCPSDKPCSDGLCGGCSDDLSSDPLNCGRCGRKCPKSKVCCNGRCTDIQGDRDHCGMCFTQCPPRQRCCSGICTDTRGGDASNCGSCGKICPSTKPVCVKGKCKKPETP